MSESPDADSLLSASSQLNLMEVDTVRRTGQTENRCVLQTLTLPALFLSPLLSEFNR